MQVLSNLTLHPIHAVLQRRERRGKKVIERAGREGGTG
jgi:hypothetical protein